MTIAVSKALEDGARAVVCASTGNTAASAAAYATGGDHRGDPPARRRRRARQDRPGPGGRRACARSAGAFEAALTAARELARRGTRALVNSLNPHRLEGQKTAAFEIVEALDGAPDVLALPYGGGGNTRAFGLRLRGVGTPRFLAGESSARAYTMATAIRIAEPAHRAEAEAVVAHFGGAIVPLSDEEILASWRELAELEGSSASRPPAAGLAAVVKQRPDSGARVVCVITGHGLKDQEAAARLST